jgi:phosphoenolpyruvate synthase/pyruvate phosphate dikinase
MPARMIARLTRVLSYAAAAAALLALVLVTSGMLSGGWFHRDDAEAGFLMEYLQRGILPKNPFATIDEAGVGQLMQMAVTLGRAVRPDLEIGICGEHGGDPDSIAFCHRIGLDYVSCSPFRVPVARLAAAHAALKTTASPS